MDATGAGVRPKVESCLTTPSPGPATRRPHRRPVSRRHRRRADGRRSQRTPGATPPVVETPVHVEAEPDGPPDPATGDAGLPDPATGDAGLPDVPSAAPVPAFAADDTEPIPPVVPVMATLPPQAAAPPPSDKHRWPAAAKITAIVLGLLFVAAVVAGVLVYKRENDNRTTAEEQRDAIAASDAEQIRTLTSERDQAQADLNTTSAELNTTKSQLATAEQEGTAAAAARDQATAQVNTLKALFPIDAQDYANGGLEGTYTSAELNAQACTLTNCPRPALTLTVARAGNSYTVSDPQLGASTLILQGQVWSGTGTVASTAVQGQCESAPVATSFTLTLSLGSVALNEDNTTRIASVVGNLSLSTPAATGASGAACPAGIAVYSLQAGRSA